jgi:hypothetical protein
MAITIEQQPALHSAIGSKTILIASSTNSGNEGFRYVLQATTSIIPDWNPFYFPPNTNGFLICDIAQIIKAGVRNSDGMVLDDASIVPVHGYVDPNVIFSPETFLSIQCLWTGHIYIAYYLLEGWDIDGVFTIDEGSITPSEVCSYYNINLSLQFGLNYNLSEFLGYNEGVNSYIMSDRLHSTHNWVEAASVGLIANDPVYIPTYESDYGVFCVFKEITDGGFANKIKLSILPSSGAPVQSVYPLSSSQEGFDRVGIYPANLNNSGVVGILKPQDYPDWKAIYFQVLNDAEDIISKTYVMYNAEKYGKCLGVFEKVRLAWVGRRGGWEYFNFTLESQQSFVTEKKIAQRAIGNYGQVGSSTPFAFNSFDESEIVTDLKVDLFLNATSGWMTDGEFEFLKGLFMSKQVHWVHDDGTHTPVIVQADGYKIQRNFNATKKYDLKIRVKIAQEQFN